MRFSPGHHTSPGSTSSQGRDPRDKPSLAVQGSSHIRSAKQRRGDSQKQRANPCSCEVFSVVLNAWKPSIKRGSYGPFLLVIRSFSIFAAAIRHPYLTPFEILHFDIKSAGRGKASLNPNPTSA